METISRFRFSDYRIKKSIVEFKDFNEVSPNLSVSIGVEGGDDRENNQFILSMNVKVCDESKNLNIDVVIGGLFEFDSDCADKELDEYFNTNAPAIMFPYVRAYITSLSALSGIGSPIILPTLNLTHLGKELKDNTKKI